jgi:hypothetical protein
MESLVPASTAETEPDPVMSARLAASIPTGDKRALNLSSGLSLADWPQATIPRQTNIAIVFI